MAQRPIQVRGLEKEAPVDKPIVTQKTTGRAPIYTFGKSL